jgi:hypothetical protein
VAVSGDALEFAMSDEDPTASGTEASEEGAAEDGEKMGPWLDEPGPRVFQLIDKEVERQEPAAKALWERHRRNTWWREGKPFARLIEKKEDQGLIKAWLPPMSTRVAPLPNKTDDLCNKLSAQITIDPFVPDVMPQTGDEEDRDAAEFATRFLKADGGEAGTNDSQAVRDAIDIACTHDSGYLHLYTDPQGGGWRPMQIEAHPESQTVEDALMKPGPVDPTTGQPGPPVRTTDGLVTRYVRPDQTLTDKPIEADREWLPKIKREILKPEHLRYLPDSCYDIADADGVILLRYCTLDEFESMYPEAKALSDEEVQKLCAWRPKRHKILLPTHVVDKKPDEGGTTFGGKTSSGDVSQRPPGTTLVFYYLGYQRSRPVYPEGAIVVAAADRVFYRGPLSAEIEDRNGELRKLCLDIPVAQFRSLNDSLHGNPHGRAIIERFGPGNEYRAAVLTAILENIDQILHPNVFLPVTSPVRPRQLAARDGTPIRIGSSEDKPTFEQPGVLPDFAAGIVDRIDTDMNSSSGLQETAQGLESPHSVSGVAKRTAVEQSLVALGQMFQNTLTGVQRYWRIKLQLARADIDVPIQIGYVGEDGAYKVEEFTGVDLSGARDVTIAKGSGTMMSPSAKQEWMAGLQQYQWIAPLDAAEAIRGGITGMLGIQDNPHLMRIRRATVEWKKGPPEGWQPPQPQMQPVVDPTTGQPAVDPTTGEPAMEPQMDPATGQPVMGPPNYNPFEPRVNDEEPEVAQVRVRELSRLLASTAVDRHPPEWRQLLDAEYERMAYAAGIQTVRQQAEAAAQQAQQQAEQQAAEQAGEQVNKAADAKRAGDEKKADREHERASQADKQQFELQRAAIKSS